MTNKIEFTKEADKQITKIIAEQGKNSYFRISVQGGGCSGFKYNFSFDDKVETDDVVFNKTIIDKNSLEIINGSVVNYKKEMIYCFTNFSVKSTLSLFNILKIYIPCLR